MNSLLKRAKKIESWGIKHRRHLHQYPEIALKEESTSKYCKEVMQSLGYVVKDSWGYGFTADLDIPNTTKKIAFRTDMDALPIREKNSHEFVSKNDGAAHMCGHDVHMAIALTTAKLLKQNIADLRCSVRFIFQPSEEHLPGGAPGMIEMGCLDGIDEIYGLHNSTDLQIGQVALREGPMMAANAVFEIMIKGKGCHAAMPQNGLSPIAAAVQFIDRCQKIPAEVNAIDIPILSVTKCHAGDTNNVIPENAEILGTMRSLQQQELSDMKVLMEESLQDLGTKGYKYSLNYILGYCPVVNHAEGVERVIDAATKVVGKDNIDADLEPWMGSEDFGYFLQKVPGAFYKLGSGNKTKNINEPLHSAYFDVDEDVIAVGAAIMAEIALRD